MKSNKKQLKTRILLIISLIFAVLTFVGAYMVLTHKVDNAGYSVVPMLFTLIFSLFYRNSKQDEKNK